MKATLAVANVLFLCVPPLASGQATRPGTERELFICAEPIKKEDPFASGVLWQLRCFDPAGGNEITPGSLGLETRGEWLRSNLLDARGQRTLNLRTVGDHERGRGHIELIAAQSGAPKRAFEELEVRRMQPAAVSPDGRKMVFFDYARRHIVIGDGTTVHAIPTKWWITRPFSWSPDSTQVAFYYADSDDGDDIHIQRHGVAVLTVTGKLRKVVKALEAFETPRSVSKDVPIGWGRSGQFVYYTAGLPSDDARRKLYEVRILFPPAVTCRVDVDTGKVEQISLGEFACVSPDEEYVLLYPSACPTGDAKWVIGTTKVQLAGRRVTHLPPEVRFPKISPSGKLIAGICNGICFYQTSDWKAYGKVVPQKQGWSMSPEEWGTEYRWITVQDGPG